MILKDQQKDEFLDTVAHELKTPITGIRAATELLLDEDDDMPSEIKSQFLENILHDSERLSRLIHNILDFEKLATDRHSLNFGTFNLEDTLNKAVNGVIQIAAQKEVSIVIQQNNDVVFSYDEDRILQVLTNLLSNAIKFCQPQVGEIKMSYQIVNDEVMVCVNDNGKGVPEEDLEYIFNRFYQSRNQNTIKPEGSGLGLAICKRIVEKHGGKIWAESKNNPGTTFVFHLPYH